MSNNRDIDNLVLELKKEFENLAREKVQLLAYRKIIDLKLQEIKESNDEKKQEFKKEFMAILEAADIGIFDGSFPSAMVVNINRNRETYKEALVSYGKVLENYKKLALELKVDSALELSHLFTYMLWNGYYAVEKKHNYNLRNRLIIPGLYSFDVIRGGGVCLAYSELLRNYLVTCEKKASLITCNIPTKKEAIERDYSPRIENNINEDIASSFLINFMMLLMRKIVRKFGNHAVTLISDDDKLFGYDVTNEVVLNVKENCVASLINGKGEFVLNPLGALMINYDADEYRLFEKLFEDQHSDAYSRKEVIFSFENVMELVETNISLLDDAYANIYKELVNIDRVINEKTVRTRRK